MQNLYIYVLYKLLRDWDQVMNKSLYGLSFPHRHRENQEYFSKEIRKKVLRKSRNEQLIVLQVQKVWVKKKQKNYFYLRAILFHFFS